MSRIFSVLGTLLLIVVFMPATTHADPIYITSGSLTVTGYFAGPHYSLSGNNFSAGGIGEPGFVGLSTACYPCTPGTVVSVFAFFAGSSLGQNHAGTFTFTGPSITIPPSLTNLTITSPFLFSGTLSTCPVSCVTGPVTSTFSVVGGGTATFELIRSVTPVGTTIFTFRTITYNFEVPEPTSILLLGSGLAALAAGLRRKYRPPRWDNSESGHLER